RRGCGVLSARPGSAIRVSNRLIPRHCEYIASNVRYAGQSPPVASEAQKCFLQHLVRGIARTETHQEVMMTAVRAGVVQFRECRLVAVRQTLAQRLHQPSACGL